MRSNSFDATNPHPQDNQTATVNDADGNVLALIGPNSPVTVYAYGADVVEEWVTVFDAAGNILTTTKIDGKPQS